MPTPLRPTGSRAAAINLGANWNGPSFGFDFFSFLFAIAIHIPLLFLKVDAHKNITDQPTNRLVAVDIIQEIPKPEVARPAPPPVKIKQSLMDKMRMMVKKEAPPPPPPAKKEPAPAKVVEAPKPIPIQPNFDLAKKLEPKLNSKNNFRTAADPKLVQDKKLAMVTGPAGIAPLSAERLGVVANRASIKSKSNFAVAANESLKGIGEGKGLSSGPADAIQIKSGRAGRENFTAPPPQKENKGRIGTVPTPGMGGPAPALGLRDSIIARDAPTAMIGGKGTGTEAGFPGGVPGGTGKSNAGHYNPGMEGGIPGGTGIAVGGIHSASPAMVAAASAPHARGKKSMFMITGPLKDRGILRQVAPEYPAWAQAQGIEASVVLEFTVTPDGLVKNNIVVRRTSGYPKLDETAIRALRQWKFVPLNGENREEVGLITFNYTLG